MSRELVVYAPKDDVVPSDAIVAALRARGVAVKWKTADTDKKGAWESADVTGTGAGADGKIRVSTEPLTDAERNYLAGISGAGAHAAAVAASRRQYFVVERARAASGERAADALVAIIADLSGGIVHDTQTDQFSSAAEFAQQLPQIGSGRGGS